MNITLVTFVVIASSLHAAQTPPVATELLAARERAYVANFRNDLACLKDSIQVFTRLAADDAVAPFARYYSGWAKWALAASQFAGGDVKGAIESGEASAADMRAALALRSDLSDFHTGLANALIVVGSLDPSRFPALITEVVSARRSALELGPSNPRALLMDAGIIFNTPPQRGGDQQKGIDRWLEAIRLFEEERRTPPANALMPDWGLPLAYGWLSQLYLNATPPRVEEARKAAETALTLRPDFWFVREQILPKLRP
jgi:tetratricopeptide (TPR) repeat protein